MMKSFFENRRLRRDLRIADQQIFQKEKYIAELKSDRDKARNTIDKQTENLSRKNAEIRKLRKQIRDQTGADLLVNALRELGVIPKPTKNYDSFAEANRLQAIANQQNRALGQANAANQLGGGMFGGVL